MQQLSQTHPATFYMMCEKGSWTLQRSTNPFAGIAADQGIEQTINRDAKTSGGVKGLTLNRGI